MRAIKILTDLQIRQAKQKENQYKLNDGNGLYLLIHLNGSKYWRMKYRFDDKEKTLSFGVWPEVSLKDAREMLRVARKKIKDGFDPIELKREKKQFRLQAQKAKFPATPTNWRDYEQFQQYALPICEIGFRHSTQPSHELTAQYHFYVEVPCPFYLTQTQPLS